MINRDFPNHDVKENVKDFPNHELCRVIVQKQYPFDQNNCTSIQTIAPHFEQLHLTENKSNHGESGKISSSYTTDLSTNDMLNSDSDSDSCLMLQLYGTGFPVREISQRFFE